jgi:hypothetical protein
MPSLNASAGVDAGIVAPQSVFIIHGDDKTGLAMSLTDSNRGDDMDYISNRNVDTGYPVNSVKTSGKT